MTREAVESIEDVVKNIIVAELRVDRNQLEPATHLMKDLGADSLDALNIALRLEEAIQDKDTRRSHPQVPHGKRHSQRCGRTPRRSLKLARKFASRIKPCPRIIC